MSQPEIVYVKKTADGMFAGTLACVLAILGILFFGTVFVPIAMIVAFFGTIIAIKNGSGAGFGVNLLAWLLIVVGFATSPMLLAIIIGVSSQ